VAKFLNRQRPVTFPILASTLAASVFAFRFSLFLFLLIKTNSQYNMPDRVGYDGPGERHPSFVCLFCLLLIFCTSLFFHWFLACLLLDFPRFVGTRFRCCSCCSFCYFYTPGRRLCLFIVDFNSKSCQLKLVKWGCKADVSYKRKTDLSKLLEKCANCRSY